MDAETLIEELRKLPFDRHMHVRGTDAWICCINPEHSGGNETTPSAKICVDETMPYFGSYHCFGCGIKMRWNTFAKQTGLATIDSEYQGGGRKTLSFRAKMKSKETKPNGKVFHWPRDRDWRGIPGSILADFEVVVPQTKDALTEPNLIIPIKMYGETVGTVRALLNDAKRDSSGRKLQKSYVNSSGTWLKSALMAFDLSMEKRFKKKPLFLVEGPRDVFRCVQADVRVNGLLGSKFSEERTELIRLMSPSVVLIGTDNDDAGNMAADHILEMCGDFVPCVRLNLPKGQDMFQQDIKTIKKWYNRAIERYDK